MTSVGQVVGDKWHQKQDNKTDLAAAEDDADHADAVDDDAVDDFNDADDSNDANHADAQIISGRQLGAKYFGTTGTRFWSQETQQMLIILC